MIGFTIGIFNSKDSVEAILFRKGVVIAKIYVLQRVVLFEYSVFSRLRSDKGFRPY